MQRPQQYVQHQTSGKRLEVKVIDIEIKLNLVNTYYGFLTNIQVTSKQQFPPQRGLVQSASIRPQKTEYRQSQRNQIRHQRQSCDCIRHKLLRKCHIGSGCHFDHSSPPVLQ